MLLAVSILPLSEGLCRLAGWGRPSTLPDPFVGFSEIHPLFEVDGSREIYRIRPSRRKFFAYESFPIAKGPRTRRIFCLGESTVKGEPYSIPTSFTTWLELALNETDDDHEWDVVNCGGISYASYRLVPILRECLQYQPDLFVVCVGHNEFLEDRTYGHLKDPNAVLRAAQEFTGRSHVVTLARQWLGPAHAGGEGWADRPRLGPETDPILDYHDSLQAYHWDYEWRKGVVAHYEFNLRRMVDLAEDAGVPIILVQPASNLSGCPPFKSEHHPALSKEREARWMELVEAARSSYATDMNKSIELLTRAVSISPGHAGTLYDLGQCCLAAGRVRAGHDWLVLARDNDVVPLRMISELEAAMRRVARDRRVPFLNAHELLEVRTPNMILGDALLVDHIHPGFQGHQAIAAALVRRLAELGYFSLPDGWEPIVEQRWDEHFESLDYTYFAKGQRFLKSLEGWTQGRGDGPPAAERFPWRIREHEAADPGDARP